ncbi:MAG: hypothetical protein KF760_17715 [Candidatus Eremiobacteraeota bacterium]|nr:hypothetical protein [Candidatus Eremiobacteraeota bacterium]MCW5867943.1 hypothetical protein [Candidatus Eremiobacteraeota bacterium]
MTGTSEELKQAWIKAWVAYGFGDYEVAAKRFQFWLQRFHAERQQLSPYWSPRMQANCEQLLAEISRHVKPARRAGTQIAEQQRVNSAFWAGRHLMVMLSRQDRTMEGTVPIVRPTPSGERLTSSVVPPAPAPRAAAPPPPPAPTRQARPAPARPAPPPVDVPVVVEPPTTPAAPPPVEVAAAPALTAPPALESEPTVEDLGDLSLDDLDLSELDEDLDLGELELDDASLEDLDMEGLEDLEGIEGLEGLDDLDLEGNLDEIDLGEI